MPPIEFGIIDSTQRNIVGIPYAVISGPFSLDGPKLRNMSIWRYNPGLKDEVTIPPGREKDDFTCITTTIYKEEPTRLQKPFQEITLPGEHIFREIVMPRDNPQDPTVLLHHSPGISSGIQSIIESLPPGEANQALQLLSTHYPTATSINGIFAELTVGNLAYFMDCPQFEQTRISPELSQKPMQIEENGKTVWKLASEVELTEGHRLSVISGFNYRIPQADLEDMQDAAVDFVNSAPGPISPRYIKNYVEAFIQLRYITPYSVMQA